MSAWAAVLKQRWPLVAVAVACGIFIDYSGAGTATKVVVVLLALAGALAWNAARNLRLHAMVNRLAALGRPQQMLQLIQPQLAAGRSPAVRVPFTIYKATALALQGQWELALTLLDEVGLAGGLADVRGAPGRTWRFLHAGQRTLCLCFVGRLDDAETVLRDELEPFAVAVRSPATQVIVDEARARLAWFQGRHDDSRAGFEALLADERITPASQAQYHYFLARICAEAGDVEGAAEHRARAAELAPETFYADATGAAAE